jgi:hypothetical protein
MAEWTLPADQCDRTFRDSPDGGGAQVTYLTETRRRAIRAGLAVLAVPAAWVGVWALAAPHSFYRSFPGGGHDWVAPLGPYDEHLVRDVGSFELALVALAIFAFVTLDRRLVQGTLVAFIVSSTPHFVYHATATDPLSTADAVLELAGLALGFVVPIVLLPLTRARRPAAAAP